MEAVTIVLLLALLQFYWFGIEVGRMRGKHQVKAPSVTGAPEFERMFRVQQNTMEQLIMFVPVLWLFGATVNPMYATVLGAVFIIGRFMYRYAYVNDPSGRSLGFMASNLPTGIMMIWLLADAVKALL